MIIKKAAERQESSAGRVIDYIQRALDYVQRANMLEEDRPITFTGNCISDDIELCKLEIQSTQDQNHRAKGDKTYHMIISFSPEDKLTTELHQKVVADVAEHLGFGEHQRVCAIHKDTSNEHCHVIINKINPKTFNILTPYYDGFQMNDIATELEQKYNLTVLNHSNEKGQEDINHKMHYDGIKSFNKWVVENAKSDVEEIIKEGGTWKEVSDELAKYNLHIRKRGRGLVISDKDKPLFIKASSVTRSFKDLGPYDDNIVSPSAPGTKNYERVPVTGPNKLWQEFQDNKEGNKEAKSEIYKTFKELKDAVYKEAKLQGIEVKYNKSLRGLAKKEQYKNIREALTAKLDELEIQKKTELAKHNSGNWLEFLMKQYNEKGDTQALEQLKKSKIFKPKFKNKMVGISPDTELFAKVDKAGNSYEEVGKDKIFLVNDSLETQAEGLVVATRLIEIGVEKYEAPLVVNGSKAFIKAVQLAAMIKGVEVSVEGQEVKQESNKQKSKDIEI